MQNGSMCSVCPLNGQRKVGVDGPRDAGVVLIGEAPGREEEEYNSRWSPNGRPFVGRSGWALKVRLLAPVGLCDTEVQEDGWIKPTKLKAFVMNVLMCRPPGNKINSPEGKRAVACCSNSARALLTELLSSSPQSLLVPLGGTALNLMSEENTIAPFRGRVLLLNPVSLALTPESDILKIALRGCKPPEEFDQYGAFLKRICATQKKLFALSSNELRAMLEKQIVSLSKPYLKLIEAVLKEQRPKKTRRKKNATGD